MDHNGKRQVTLVMGKTGSGKTTLVKKILRNYPRILLLDPLYEYEGFIVNDFAGFVSAFSRFHAKEDSEFRYSCRFSDLESSEFLFEAAWVIGDLLLVVEEADTYIGSGDSAFHKLVNVGRHMNISLLCVSRRIPDLPPSFRAQCDTMVTFNQTEGNDLTRLQKLGFDPQVVSSLDPFEFSLWGKPVAEFAVTN